MAEPVWSGGRRGGTGTTPRASAAAPEGRPTGACRSTATTPGRPTPRSRALARRGRCACATRSTRRSSCHAATTSSACRRGSPHSSRGSSTAAPGTYRTTPASSGCARAAGPGARGGGGRSTTSGGTWRASSRSCSRTRSGATATCSRSRVRRGSCASLIPRAPVSLPISGLSRPDHPLVLGLEVGPVTRERSTNSRIWLSLQPRSVKPQQKFEGFARDTPRVGDHQGPSGPPPNSPPLAILI